MGSDPMRVIHLIGGGDTGGAKTHVLNLLKELNQYIDAQLFCFRKGDFSEDAAKMGIPIEVIESGNPVVGLRELKRRLAGQKVDIIHCHGWMTALAPLYIKKVYKDEPSFRDAKVIFSLYEDDFKQPFHADFSNKLLLKGIAKKDIAGLKEPIDYTALCKLAADFSDGIIQQSEHVNEEVLNYARESGKPVLEYQSPENFAEACNDFYDKVWETEQK